MESNEFKETVTPENEILLSKSSKQSVVIVIVVKYFVLNTFDGI